MASRIIDTSLSWRFDRIPLGMQLQVINWFHLNDFSRLKIHYKKWAVMPAGLCDSCGVNLPIAEWTKLGIDNGYIVISNT